MIDQLSLDKNLLTRGSVTFFPVTLFEFIFAIYLKTPKKASNYLNEISEKNTKEPLINEHE